ncbi:MAG: exodeoxyribonuclease VII large subunit [Deltaproteobacteria bacterium]|nr:exodeoxyribonuclease VII large subunit [Deltaproteobacteria bacterium]MBW2152799.1 exodeoxyribonuclease VII large subunit [Deltaproteobacteria bacterium]
MFENNRTSRIYTVSELTRQIKELLENQFPFIWITGEISNFKIPVSGHFYFVLKDENSQINAVMFRGQNQLLKFLPEDGMSVTGLGRISVYEPRGTYQIIFEMLEPKGIGALQVAFEQLKMRLAEEGLFDERHKKPIPFLPRKIALITSPTGAVVHDILKVLSRRFSTIPVEIYPVKVQGAEAASEIASGFERLNTRKGIDVIILARGGGSLEDLQAFNSETVARAIFNSKIPVVSAVGHETDFTIADFVADLRAPTPSAAAELIVPVKADLQKKCYDLAHSLNSKMNLLLERLRKQVADLSNRLVDPRKRVYDLRLRCDDLTDRLIHIFQQWINQKREHLLWKTHRLYSNNPMVYIDKNRVMLDKLKYNLLSLFKKLLIENHTTLRELTGKLDALNPKSVLQRGYSITLSLPQQSIVTDSTSVKIDQKLKVLLAKGSLTCQVKRKM